MTDIYFYKFYKSFLMPMVMGFMPRINLNPNSLAYKNKVFHYQIFFPKSIAIEKKLTFILI